LQRKSSLRRQRPLFPPWAIGANVGPAPGFRAQHPVDRLFPHTRLAFSAPHHLIGEGVPTAHSKLRAGVEVCYCTAVSWHSGPRDGADHEIIVPELRNLPPPI
jgi:hypothetical protein